MSPIIPVKYVKHTSNSSSVSCVGESSVYPYHRADCRIIIHPNSYLLARQGAGHDGRYSWPRACVVLCCGVGVRAGTLTRGSHRDGASPAAASEQNGTCNVVLVMTRILELTVGSGKS